MLYAYEEHLSDQKFENKQWKRIWEANTAESIEHVMPQYSGKRHIHWLGNLLLLPPRLNEQLGKCKPTGKYKEYTKTGLLIAQDVGERIAKNSRWNEADIVKRETELLEWAAKRWSD